MDQAVEERDDGERGISGLILAGGRGSRMGDADKGLQTYRGHPLVVHVARRFGRQVDSLAISANRNIDTYAGLGYPVLVDEVNDFRGPLAGVQAGLRAASAPLLAVVPCDAPLLPSNLVETLARALEARQRDAVFATAHGRDHPVFCLVKRELEPHLAQYLERGETKMRSWLEQVNAVAVVFDDAHAFTNINTLAELDDNR